MIDILLKILGIGDTGITNKVAGGINLLALAPLGIWLWSHKADTILFTYEQLGIFALVIFGYIELNRRAV